jgi:hypothetical protein
MKRKIIVLSIVLLFLFCGVITSGQLVRRSRNQGLFNAEIGLGRDQRPDIDLDGNFHMRGRIRIVSGSYDSSDYNGRFHGMFFGESFIINMLNRGRNAVLFGRVRISEDHTIFSGTWHGRGIDRSGWITGEFITRE